MTDQKPNSSTCPQNRIWDHCPHAAAIRNATLKDFGERLIKEIEESPGTWEKAPLAVCMSVIKSLRTPTTQEHNP